MSYHRDEYKSEYELRREKERLSDRWHDPDVQRRWAAEDRIREINYEFNRREDRRREEEEEKQRQERQARDRREAARREQEYYEYEREQRRLHEEQEQESDADREMFGDDNRGLEDIGNK